jgi:hypothetical protein
VTTALRWNHVWTPKLFSNTTTTFSRYNLDFGADYGTVNTITNQEDRISLGYVFEIDDFAATIDFDYLPSPKHFIKFGIIGIHHNFKPGLFDLEQIDESTDYTFSSQVGQQNIKAQEIAAYIEDDFEVTEDLKVNIGLHTFSFFVKGKGYHSLQPRLAARYLLPNQYSIKGSFYTMRQYVQLLAFEGIGSPTDLWLPTTDRVKPQDAWQWC